MITARAKALLRRGARGVLIRTQNDEWYRDEVDHDGVWQRRRPVRFESVGTAADFLWELVSTVLDGYPNAGSVGLQLGEDSTYWIGSLSPTATDRRSTAQIRTDTQAEIQTRVQRWAHLRESARNRLVILVGNPLVGVERTQLAVTGVGEGGSEPWSVLVFIRTTDDGSDLSQTVRLLLDRGTVDADRHDRRDRRSLVEPDPLVDAIRDRRLSARERRFRVQAAVFGVGGAAAAQGLRELIVWLSS